MTSAMSHAGEAAATAVQVAHRHFVIVLVNYHRVIWTRVCMHSASTQDVCQRWQLMGTWVSY